MNSRKIVTVTLNPSLDRTLITHYLSLGYHNHISDTTRLHPAGRGVNIARALHSMEIPTHAIVVLADDANGAAYRRLIQQEALPVSFVFHHGNTRSNVTLMDTGNQQETHIIERSTGLTPEVATAVAEALLAQVGEGDFVVFAGSLPDEAPSDTYSLMVTRVRARGAIVGVSVTSEAMVQAIASNPDLLALTQNEVERFFNHPVRTDEDILYCGRKLLERAIKQVLVIQPEGRAMLVTSGGAWNLQFAEESLGTQTGVKEAVLAGYLAGRARGLSTAEALELGGAAAVYTSGQIGSEFGTIDEIGELSDGVDVSAEETAGPPEPVG